MAAAWYPRDTNTSSAASSSCRRLSCRGSRVPPTLAVVVIVEADGAFLLGRIRLVDVKGDFAPRYGPVLVRNDFLLLLVGVALGRLHVQLAQRPDPLFLLIGMFWAARGPGQLAERCLQCFPVGREGMHRVGQHRDRHLGP